MTENSQNIGNNTSNVTVSLKLKRNDGYGSSAYNLNEDSNSVTLTVGGVQRVSRHLTIDTRNSVTVTLASFTGNLTHNADGTLALAVAGTFSMGNTSLTGGSVSGSFNCETIPRASSMTISPTSVNVGSAVNLAVTSVSSSFSHRVVFTLGSRSSTVSLAANVLSGSFTVPTSWANEITDAQSARASVALVTYRGTAVVGSKTYSLTVRIPDNSTYRPDFSLSVAPSSEEPLHTWNVFCKGKNSLTVSVTNVSLKNGATLKQIATTFNGMVKTGANVSFACSSAGNFSLSVTLTDSRGLKKTVTQSVTVLDYKEPNVTVNSFIRCNQDGTPNNSGTYLKCDFTETHSSVGAHNTVTVSLSYRRNGGGGYTDVGTVSSPVIFGGGAIVNSSSYETKITVTDDVSSETVEVIRRIGSADVSFNIKAGGKGASFGCFAETDNELTVGYDLNVIGKIKGTDITSSVVLNSSVVSGATVKAKYYACLNTVFFNAMFDLCANIQPGVDTLLFTLADYPPSQLTILCAIPNSGNGLANGFIHDTGRMKIRCSQLSPTGDKVFVSGVWTTNDEE